MVNNSSTTYNLLFGNFIDPELVKVFQRTGYFCEELRDDSINETSIVILSESELPFHDSILKNTLNPLIIVSDETKLCELSKNDLYKSNIWHINNKFDKEDILLLVAKACIFQELQTSIKNIQVALLSSDECQDVVAVSSAMKDIIEKSKILAAYNSTILITGESGTGKTMLANYIHNLSSKRDAPFVSINCASMPRELLESELFGHEKGAFTGAYQTKMGMLELADGGTVFLDEIADLPLCLQSKLLSVLQDKIIRKIGSNKSRKINIRIIAATNRNLEELTKKKEFRDDLFFRLNVISLKIPSLRERKEDLKILVQNIIKKISIRLNKQVSSVTPQAYDLMYSYDWPGNVRELENVLERVIVFSDKSTITIEDLRPCLQIRDSVGDKSALNLAGWTLKDIEKQAILDTLQDQAFDKRKAAKVLGISLKSLYNKLALYNS